MSLLEGVEGTPGGESESTYNAKGRVHKKSTKVNEINGVLMVHYILGCKITTICLGLDLSSNILLVIPHQISVKYLNPLNFSAGQKTSFQNGGQIGHG